MLINNAEELNQAEYLYDLLQKIREKCGLYLGSPSITRLDSFLIGYWVCRRDLGIPGTEQEGEFHQFHEWVAKKYRLKYSTQGWPNIILAHSNNNEEEAFNKFWELFDQFVASKKKGKKTAPARE